jgi:zinc protease
MTDIREHALDNGLRIALQPDPSIPVVGIAVYYDVGSRNEERGRSGFAHLFEHMMFEGSANVKKTEHFRHISSWGGTLNGTTSQDRTNYYESLPSHQLRLGLWLEADRMRSLAVTDENFENQRQTVMEERRQRIDNSPYGHAFIRVGEVSFKSWAYSHPVIGYWEDLEAAGLEDVQAFHSRWYRPDNAVLAIAGDFDPDEALAIAGDYFGDIARGTEARPAPRFDSEQRAGLARESLSDPLAKLPAILVNHPAPTHDDPAFYVYEAIETLLFRGPSSRAYRRLVLEERSAVQVSGGYESYRGPSLFGLFAVGPAGSDTSRIEAGYRAELERLADELVPDEELEKALNQLKAAKVFGQESVLNKALTLGRSMLYYGDASWEERYLERVAAVTPADIQAVARKAFAESARVELRVQPA